MSVTEEEAPPAENVDPGDKTNPEQDETIAGLCGDSKPELSDPAILAVLENPKYRYDRDELIKLREVPMSQRKPDFVDINEISPTIWDATKWNFDRKKSDTPIENGTRPGDIPDHRRRPGDPRERLRKENDGIVLSPQRRSFNSGCFVPVRELPSQRPNRPHSPPTGAPPHLEAFNRESSAPPGSKFGVGGGNSSQTTNRRIGSGRILRDWDYGDKPDASNDVNDYGFGRNQRNSGGGAGGNSVFTRFDFDPPTSNNNTSSSQANKEKRGGRYGDRRRDQREMEEPEWFSSGPISQNDTIELRGFDDGDKLGQKKKMSPSQAKRARDWKRLEKKVASYTIAEEQQNKENPTDPNETESREKSPNTVTNDGTNAKKTDENSAKDAPNKERNDKDDVLFEEILKCDSIFNFPRFLDNGDGTDGDNNGSGGGGTSRFSQWFTVDEPHEGTRKPSLENEARIKNLLSDIFEPSNVTIPSPGESDSYFAPISPAANTGGANGPKSSVANMMEMLHKTNKQNEMKSQMPGRIMNLADLESKIRQAEPHQIGKHHHKSDDDMAAFNRLLEQVTGGHAVIAAPSMTSPKTQPMTLMEMLSHSQQQDEARMAAQILAPVSPAHHHGDFNNAGILQQIQNQKQTEMLSKFVNAKLHSYQHDAGMQQQSRELLNRPEAQAILQGLKRGDITPQHLYQQLANPALQPRHRDMLGTILKLQGGATGGGGGGTPAASASATGPSPRVLSPVAPPSQQQQLRVSPLPPNAYCVSPIMATSPNTLTVPALHQRIPSPRELQVHTQNILQRALIRKKLEEQQENYRKKQEMQQRGQSPNNNNNNNNNGNVMQATKSVLSPTPLAFTPTSVLRKMTADKDEGHKDVVNKLEKGRAVTGMKQTNAVINQQLSPSQQLVQPQQQAIGQWNFGMSVKQPGRPIVKANNFQQAQSSQDQFFTQQQQQQKLFNQLAQAQQQQQQQQQQQRNKYHGGHGYPNQQFQQLRAQHQQHARPTTNASTPTTTTTQQSSLQQPMNFADQTGTVAWQQFLNQNQGRNQLGRTLNDGDLSPTSNQLTRWFSPDLLERARGGELPSTAGLGQHALSLEEIERLTAPPVVHN